MDKLRVILIGGSSNAGKSTLAEALATKLGWRHISTDSLARHPGRPWKTKPETVPTHVAEHYMSLSVDELIKDVLRHYRSMWPNIEALITTHATDDTTDRLILEGSALWPESVATLQLDNVGAIWLTASNELFQERIYAASRFGEATAREQMMIQKFLERTQCYNGQMLAAIKRLGLISLNIETTSSLDELIDASLALLNTGLIQ
ncbi:hypothetical protein BH10CHL1_BH10CHL1_11380 [soil metagenome]